MLSEICNCLSSLWFIVYTGIHNKQSVPNIQEGYVPTLMLIISYSMKFL